MCFGTLRPNGRWVFLITASLSVALPVQADILAELKPEKAQRILKSKSVETFAQLDGEAYRFEAIMLVYAEREQAFRIMTRYADYKDLIPLVSQSHYDSKTRTLDLEGGILGYVLRSQLQFDETRPNRIRFRIVGGHFKGMTGEVDFEGQKPRGTLIRLRGSQRARFGVPKWVLEKGAEVALGLAGRRMQNHIERQSTPPPKLGGETHGPNEPASIPQPQRRIHPGP